jgi:hypothetical protein
MKLRLGNKESSLRMWPPVSPSAECSKIRRVDKLEIELRPWLQGSQTHQRPNLPRPTAADGHTFDFESVTTF